MHGEIVIHTPFHSPFLFLPRSIFQIEEKLKALLSAKSEGEVMSKIQEFTANIAQITQTATLRLNVRILQI